MKQNIQLGLALAVTMGLVALTGCPGGIPGTGPSVAPSATPTPASPASKLQGRVTFALDPAGMQDPGQALTLKLKRRKTGETEFTTLNNATTSTDASGSFTFTGLENAEYQVVYDDGGQTVEDPSGFNVAGVAVSDAATVSATQNSVPQVNLEVAWDFGVNSNSVPRPNTTLTSRSNVAFQWQAKPGVVNPRYIVTIFKPATTASYSATLSSPSATVGSANTTLTFGIPATAGSTSAGTYEATPAGTNYYVIKYYTGTTWGNASHKAYGQTKLIRINLP